MPLILPPDINFFLRKLFIRSLLICFPWFLFPFSSSLEMWYFMSLCYWKYLFFSAPAPASLRVINLKLDILCYSPIDFPVPVAVSELVIPGLADQMSVMKKIISPEITQQAQVCDFLNLIMLLLKQHIHVQHIYLCRTMPGQLLTGRLKYIKITRSENCCMFWSLNGLSTYCLDMNTEI